MVKVNIKGREFYLDGYLKKKLDNIKKVVFEKNFDLIFNIDGIERVGKSSLGITCGYYLSDGNFSIDNIATDLNDAIHKIERLPDKSVLMIDEGSLVFSSRDSMRRDQKKLIKIMNVVGQKNMIFIIVLPSFFDLNKQIAVRRSRFLLHCYTDSKLNRGRFAYFGEDKKRHLFIEGKKNHDSYWKPEADFVGRFADFNPLGEEYLETKKKSLISALHDDEEVKLERTIRSEEIYKIITNLEAYDFPFKPSQEDKANMIGISLTNYKKHLKKLREEGNKG